MTTQTLTATELFVTDETTLADLVAAYNTGARKFGEPEVKRFSDRKTAMRRTSAMMERVMAEIVQPKHDPVPAPKAPKAKKAPAAPKAGVLDAVATGADGWTVKIGFAGTDRKAAIRAIRDHVKAIGESGKHGVIRFKAVKG